MRFRPLIWRNRRPAPDATLASCVTTACLAMSNPVRIAASAGCIAAAFAAALAFVPAARAADVERGRALYELRCGACHTESVHGREHRVARDLADVRGWVRRWNESLATGWTDAEIDDVAAYLNATYYKFDCATSACSAVSMTTRGAR